MSLAKASFWRRLAGVSPGRIRFGGRIWMGCAGLFFGGVGVASAHPVHASVAEADYRAGSGKLEVALRLFSDDAEAALGQRAGKKVVLEKMPAKELAALLQAYLADTFVVKARDGAVQPLSWVGCELKTGDQYLWVYFECALPGGIAGARFADRVLRETFSDQINSIRLGGAAAEGKADSGAKVTLLFTDGAEQAVGAPR